jgi:hypothetical protein
MYSEMKKNMLNSDIAMSSETTFAPRSVRLRKIENGTSGWRWRRSMTTKAARMTSDRAPSPSVFVEPQPAWLASTSV